MTEENTVPSEAVAAIESAYLAAGGTRQDVHEMHISFVPGQEGFDMARAFGQWLASVTGKRVGVFSPEWDEDDGGRQANHDQ
jgi:hypothetical protein